MGPCAPINCMQACPDFHTTNAHATADTHTHTSVPGTLTPNHREKQLGNGHMQWAPCQGPFPCCSWMAKQGRRAVLNSGMRAPRLATHPKPLPRAQWRTPCRCPMQALLHALPPRLQFMGARGTSCPQSCAPNAINHHAQQARSNSAETTTQRDVCTQLQPPRGALRAFACWCRTHPPTTDHPIPSNETPAASARWWDASLTRPCLKARHAPTSAAAQLRR